MEPVSTIPSPKRPIRSSRPIFSLMMAACLTASGFAASQSQKLERFTYTEYHMGVDSRLVVYAPDKTTAENACAAAFERIAQLD